MTLGQKTIFSIILALLLYFNLGCSAQGSISDLSSQTAEVKAPTIDQGTNFEIMPGETVTFSGKGGPGASLQFQDSGSGNLSSNGTYALPSTSTLLQDTIRLWDATVNLVASLVIKVVRMRSVDQFETNYQSAPWVTTYGMGQSPGGTLWMVAGTDVEWLVYKSSNGGATYVSSDLYVDSEGIDYTRPFAVFAKSESIVFVGGAVKYGFSSNIRWLVRRSLDGGATWTNIDRQGTTSGAASGITSDSSGNVVVVGSYDGNWVIRRSTDNGTNWTTTLSTAGSGAGITKDPVTGNLFAVGKVGANVVVKKSTDNGLNWSNVDSYAGSQGVVSSSSISARNDVVVYVGYDRSSTATLNFSCGGWSSNGRWFARVSTNAGSSWGMPDNFIRSSPCNSKAVGVGIDSNGLIFAGGNYDSVSNAETYNIVRKSLDNGTSFSDVDQIIEPTYVNNSVGGVFVDSSNRIHVLGSMTDYRLSSNGGTSWATVPNQFRVPYNSGGAAITATSSGQLIAAGSQQVGNGYDNSKAIFNKSSDFGATWTGVTSGFGMTDPTGSQTSGIVEVSAGNYIMVGNSTVSSTSTWVALRSTDGGATWAQTDAYICPSSTSGIATAVAKDSKGVLYAVGYCAGGPSFFIGVVRKSTDGGASWSLVDSYAYTANRYTGYQDIAIDSSDQVYVLGTVEIAANEYRWLVRKSSDRGASWSNVLTYVPSGAVQPSVGASRIKISKSDQIFVTGGFLSATSLLGQLISSSDGGATWEPLITQSVKAGYGLPTTLVAVDDNDAAYFALVDIVYGTTIWKSRNYKDWYKVDSTSEFLYAVTACKDPASGSSRICAVGAKRLTGYYSKYVWTTRVLK